MTAMFACAGAFLWLITIIAVLYLIVGVLSISHITLNSDSVLVRIVVVLLWPAFFVMSFVVMLYDVWRDYTYGRYMRRGEGSSHVITHKKGSGV